MKKSKHLFQNTPTETEVVSVPESSDEGLQRQVKPPERRMSFEEYRNRPLPMRFNHRVPVGGQHVR